MSSDLAQVAKTDDVKDTLKVLRDRLAEAIDGTTSARDLAALARRFIQVLEAVQEATAATPEPPAKTPLDRLREEMVEGGHVELTVVRNPDGSTSNSTRAKRPTAS